MNDILAWTHPELASRYEDLVGLMWNNGWHVSVVSATRSREEQNDLYQRWLAGTFDSPSVANPYTYNGESPWGFSLYGSNHMTQYDGYSHALDLSWLGCTQKQFEWLANQCGLYLTVLDPFEGWHFQIFPHVYSKPVPIFPTTVGVDQAMSTTVYQPDLRPGTDDSNPIYDFPLLARDASVDGRMRVESRILIRQRIRDTPPRDKVILVWCNGVPHPVQVLADGRVTEFPVTDRGFCSVGGSTDGVATEGAHGMQVEARELWLPA